MYSFKAANENWGHLREYNVLIKSIKLLFRIRLLFHFPEQNGFTAPVAMHYL